MKPGVLMVSKPVAPPWNDSSKNLVKDLALSGQRYSYHVLTPEGCALVAPGVISEPVYAGKGSFTPPLSQNLRVLWRLLRRDTSRLSHFFFAPNLKAALAARLALRLRPRLTLQTVCSTPASYDQAGRLLFADHVIALSRHTQGALINAGIPAERISVIPPGIQPPALPSPTERQQARLRLGLPAELPLVIYPGDYQFSSAAQTFAAAIAQLSDLPAHFVFACRIKQAESRALEQQIRAQLAAAGQLGRVTLLNEVPQMLELLGACDLCALPAESLYAKMDLPLVLLEAMALGLPLVLADRPPLCELLDDDVGLAVPPGDAAALAAALRRLLTSAEQRQRQGELARQVARGRFAIATISQTHEDLYDHLLRGTSHA